MHEYPAGKCEIQPLSHNWWMVRTAPSPLHLVALVDLVAKGTVRGTTTLVYLQLHISLYTDTVHVLSRVAGVHPTSLTID
jgi:hypothetical protein